MGGDFLSQAVIYLSAAVISVPLSKRLGLGSVLGYLIAGIIVGPFALGLVGEEREQVMHFAEFGVVMMLFLIGLELQPSLLWRMRGPIIGAGGGQVISTSILLGAIAYWFGQPWQAAAAIGMTLALSSTAITLQTLNEKGLMQTDGGQSSFAVLLFQDIAVIPMLALFPALAIHTATTSSSAAHGHTWIEGLPAWGQALAVLAVVAMIILAGRFFVSYLFRFIAKSRLREIFTAAALLLIVGIALLMTGLGLSPALGTFLAGVVLANSEYRHELEADIEPFKGLLLGLFFIAIGASIDFGVVAREPGMIGGLVALLIIGKFLLLLILGRIFSMSFDQCLLFAFALAQGGEFAFVLFSFAEQSGVLTSEVTGPLIAVVALSMAISPLLMLFNEKVIQPRFGTVESEEREADTITAENEVIIAGFGKFGNIVGRLLRANGFEATLLDLDSDNVDLLRKLGFKVFYGDASRPDLLHSAGAKNAKLIILAINDPENVKQMVATIQEHFPHLQIMVRASNRADAYELLESGVEHVYRETFDTSLRMGAQALRLLGFESHQAHRSERIFRRRDEKDLRDLALLRHDKQEYMSSARKFIVDLERLMTEEMQRHDENRDAGWDSEPIRREFGNVED